MGDTYATKLNATKKSYPFKEWRQSGIEFGMEQYTEKACNDFVQVFDTLITKLISLGEKAPEEKKLACFKVAVLACNDLNEADPGLIETGERENLCELCNDIATAAGLDYKKYGHGEGPASEWRDW